MTNSPAKNENEEEKKFEKNQENFHSKVKLVRIPANITHIFDKDGWLLRKIWRKLIGFDRKQNFL